MIQTVLDSETTYLCPDEATAPIEQVCLESTPGRFWSENDLRQYKEWLFREKYESLIHFARSRLSYSNERPDAEDAWMQFTVDRLDHVLNSYDPNKGRAVYSWLLYKLDFYCRDLNQASSTKGRRVQNFEEVHIEVLPGSSPAKATYARDLLQAAINKLAAQEKNLFVARYLEEKTYLEISSLLGIPVGTVRSRLFALRNKMKLIFNSIVVEREDF